MNESAKSESGAARWQRAARWYESSWGPVTGLFIPELLDSARVRPGNRILDLATGPGLVAEQARERRNEVVGLDLSSAMVHLARRRVPTSFFVVGDGVHLPFAERAFDAAVINFGLHHFWDPAAALLALARSVRPGGRVSYSTWAPSEENRALEAIDAVFEEHLPGGLGTPSRDDFGFGRPDQMRAALAAVGCRAESIEIATVRHHWRPARAEDVYEAELRGGGRKSELLACQAQTKLGAIRRAVVATVSQFETPSGIAIPLTANVVSAAWTESDG